MESCPSLAGFLRRLIGLTVAGAVILLFAGPILTVLCMVAVCATVGFLVWLPIHTIFCGKHNACYSFGRGARHCRHQVELRLQTVRAMASRLIAAANNWLLAVRDTLLEVACGAAVGIVVAVVADIGDDAVGVGALVGAAAGVGILLSRKRPLAA